MVMRYIFGIGLILLGIGFLLSQFSIFNFGEFLLTWWPVLIIFLGLSKIFNSNKSDYSGYFIIAIGLLLQLNALNIIQTGFWSAFWPLLLIYIGVSIIFKSKKNKNGKFINNDKFEIFNIFSENHRVIESKEFEKGEIATVFGSSKVDFRSADYLSGTGLVDVSVTFGSIVIIVPPNVNITTNGFPIFGALENKTFNPVDNPNFKTLNIKFFIMFGSLEIKNN
jgi:predicted membrane protein